MKKKKRQPPAPDDEVGQDVEHDDPPKMGAGGAETGVEDVTDEFEDEKPKVDKDDLIEEARERFKMAEDRHKDNRERYKEAIDFISGDQWPPELKQARKNRMLPCLTMDRLSTHINLVVNAQRQNKPAVKVHPVDDTGDVQIADIYDGVIRHIEAVSNADTAYETAGFCQAAGGQGYVRVLTQFKDETAFEQDIIIQRITNPLAVYFDPDAREMDGSDGHWVFIVDSMTRDRFKDRYGEDVDMSSWSAEDPNGWWTSEDVRLAEYYRVIHEKETIFLFDDGTSMFESDYDQSLENGGDPRTIVKKRKGLRRVVQWFKLGGNEIIDSRIWPGRWLPVARVVGNEIDVEGDLQYTGLVHRLMDPQRAYNYWTSKSTETVASIANSPYIGYKGQFKGVEKAWKNAHTDNPAYLEVEPMTIDEKPAPLPQRASPPQVPSGSVEMTQAMADDMRWISGQQEANFGAPSNEQSGRAILARQQQGNTATYHYLDNLARLIRCIGRIIVDMVPRVLSTQQVLRTLGEDGSSDYVNHDADQQQAVTEQPDEVDPNAVRRIYNLGVGRYDVEVSVGPNFTTRRLEGVDAMQALLQADPALWQVIGDIYLRNQDWPGAQDMADRLSKMVDPKLKDDPNAPEGQKEAQMQQALQQLQGTAEQQGAKLQHAQMLADQADAEIAELKQKLLKAETDINAKTLTAQASLAASKYTDDVKLEIARINAVKDEASAAVTKLGADVGDIQAVIAALSRFVQDQAASSVAEEPAPSSQ